MSYGIEAAAARVKAASKQEEKSPPVLLSSTKGSFFRSDQSGRVTKPDQGKISTPKRP